MAKTTKRPISRGSVSECLAVLYELEAQVAGAVALIGIEYREDDPDGSLLQAVRLLQTGLGKIAELAALLEPDAVGRRAASALLPSDGPQGRPA